MGTGKQKRKIVVVGGGVIGLSTAVVLLRRGHDVTIVADKFGPDTNSRLATAVWHVFLIKGEDDISANDPHLAWAQQTLDEFVRISTSEPNSGIEMVRGVELFRRDVPRQFPAWMDIAKRVLDLKMLTQSQVDRYNDVAGLELPDAERNLLQEHPVTWGYELDAPAAKMSTYLQWLVNKSLAYGGVFRQETISALREVQLPADILVNCTGLGSRSLANDAGFTPYKGQYFVLEGDGRAPKSYVGDDHHPGGMAYAIPRAGQVLVGGTAEVGVDDLTPSVAWDDVRSRAALYVPWLRQFSNACDVGPPVVGIRPVRRDGVRLEIDHALCDVPVIHNYGHGGSGFSLSWGCAEEVARLVESAHVR